MTRRHPARRLSLTGVALSVALAFSSAAEAWVADQVLDADGNLYAYFRITEPGETYIDEDEGVDVSAKVRTWAGTELEAVKKGVLYWADVLGASVGKPTMRITFLAEHDDNAAATSYETMYDESGVALTKLEACVRGLVTCTTEDADIVLHQPKYADTWTWLGLSTIPANGMTGDGVGTMIHELGHAYGIATYQTTTDAAGNSSFMTDRWNIFAAHLVDIYGKSAAAGMTISPVGRSNATNSSYSLADAFQVMANASDYANGGVKFVGTNVSEVLKGDYQGAPASADEVMIYYSDSTFVSADGSAIIARNSILYGVTGGLPINSIESGQYEFSHIELQNSLMSHQLWRNYQTLLEAELALLEDIGYEFDRKRFFGTSVYESGNGAITITQAFTGRENYAWTGAPSTQSLAIGVHVYGSVNNVTVAADQLADGAESIGVRVDGIGNDITVASGVTITANGENGRGIAFAYGRNHTLTLEQGSVVTAAGPGGRALSFDFGSNEIGDYYGYRGSFGSASLDDNGVWDNYTIKDALNGALMESVRIAGTVSAPSGTAIYIASNALVSGITIATGASIEGDIVSEWNARSTVATDESGTETLRAANSLYSGIYTQAPAGTDLTTNLIFGDSDDFDFTYAGNITGADGIRVTFGAGTTTYSGTASVLGVVLEEGATVKGAGTYILTAAAENESDAQARVSDEKFRQGMFVNYGTLWSSGATGNVTIQGDYVQAAGSALVVGLRSTGTINPLRVTGDAMTSNDADTETESESSSEASAATLLTAAS
ncbi:MAG: hypothetical protein Q4F91_06650, partial [Sutterella sp.]|nr:hypothetical protein [Sutterella sp.]